MTPDELYTEGYRDGQRGAWHTLAERAKVVGAGLFLAAVAYVLTVLILSLEPRSLGTPECVSVPYDVGARPSCVIVGIPEQE